MAYAPCKNTACKSYGKPHPNCRCYGEFAEGGEVGNYCEGTQTHRRDCKYFKLGGEVHPLDVPPHEDAHEAVSSYLVHRGLHGLLKEPSGVPEIDLDKHNQAINRGHKHFKAHMASLFDGGDVEPRDLDKSEKAIDEWISKGGISHDLQQETYKQHAAEGFAEGGDVEQKQEPKGVLHKNPVADHYPDHNVMLQEAKGRISNYLNTLKPQPNQPRLAFDAEPDDTQQKKSYKDAVRVAAHPLSVLEKLKKGTLGPKDILNLKNMYPEVMEQTQKRITEKIVEAQLKGKKPSYRIRQGLSLFMGAPLSGELTPQSIMAAQAVFQGKKAQQQSQTSGMGPKNTSALKTTDDSYLTANQAAASRQQKQ